MKKDIFRLLFVLALFVSCLWIPNIKNMAANNYISESDMVYEYSSEYYECAMDYLSDIYMGQYPQLGLRIKYGDGNGQAAIATLSSNLSAECKTDREKVDTMARWITEHIEYGTCSSPFPVDTFRERTGGCTNMALLLEELCRHQNIPAVIVSGYRADLKSITLKKMLNSSNLAHAWVMVYVDSNWELYDPTWGEYAPNDVSYIAENYFFEYVEGIHITPNCLKIEDLELNCIYKNNKFWLYEYGDIAPYDMYEQTKGFFIDKNNHFLDVFNYNFIVKSENNGWAYRNNPDRMEEACDGELIRDGWIDYGNLESHYVYENGLFASNTVLTSNKKKVYLDEKGTCHNIILDENEYCIKSGLLSVDSNFCGKIVEPEWLSRYNSDEYDIVWSVENVLYPEEDSFAIINDEGVLFAKEEGLVCIKASTYNKETGGNNVNYYLTVYICDDLYSYDYSDTYVHKYDTKWSSDGTNHWHECTVCGDKKDCAVHTLKTTTTKATLTANGKKETKCSECGKVTKTETIYAAKTIKLSATKYTYDGKAKKPTVTIKDSKGNVIASTNYTITYPSGRKNVGKYTVKVTFKGNYSGSKNLTFTINPPKTSISKLTAGKKAFTVKWAKKTTQITGYEIQYSTSSSFKSGNKTVKVTSAKTASKTIKSLKAKKKYYVRIRTYKTVNKVNYYSDWSAKKSVTTKK